MSPTLRWVNPADSPRLVHSKTPFVSHVSQEVRVSYSADYRFYALK